MKTRLLSALVIIASITACTKDKKNNPSGTFVGQWTWVRSSGGLAGQTQTPASTGETRSIEFASNGQYRIVTNGNPVYDQYQLVNGTDIYTGTQQPMLQLGNGIRQTYTLRSDTLFLFDQCVDCYSHVYVRQ